MTPDLAIVRDFVNTLDVEDDVEALDSPAALRDWLASHDLLHTAVEFGDDDLHEAVALREALRSLALANHADAPRDPAASATLHAVADRARLTARVAGGAGVTLQSAATGLDAALGRLVAAVVVASIDGTWARFKVCPWDTCQWAFIDRSKNRSRTWCSMQDCGNRAKARAFRARRAQAG